MNFMCQTETMTMLQKFADSNRHSVLIEGPAGCGKTHCAKSYASLLNISDVYVVQPTVQNIRDAVNECFKLTTNVVLCIENLDLGVSGAAYALLKFLEEPLSNTYIVVTCRNIYRIPETILSRSVQTSINPPTIDDIIAFASQQESSHHESLQHLPIWKCANTFSDVEYILSLDTNKLQYFANLSNMLKFNGSVADMMWKLGHFDDNSSTREDIVIRYIMEIANNPFITACGIDCIKDLLSGRIASHAVLGKFLFQCKYCE